MIKKELDLDNKEVKKAIVKYVNEELDEGTIEIQDVSLQATHHSSRQGLSNRPVPNGAKVEIKNE